jgi:hypothetical protein
MFGIALVLFTALAFAAPVSPPSSPPQHDITGPAPLHIINCQLVIEHHGPRGPVQQVVAVSFSNDRDAPADIARFAVSNAGGANKAFTARGSFTKGVLIADRILPAQLLPAPASATGDAHSACTLTYAHFADGSSWER